MDNGYIEIGCSIFMKGVMLPGYGNVMNVMRMGSNMDAMICLLLLGEIEGGGQSNCIVV